MKALRGTLTFVLGMIIGIILFVVGIGGAVYAISTSVSIGKLQDTLHIDFIDSESEIINKSIFDVVVDLIDDIKNLDKLTINTLIKKYGLPIPKKVSGIDISVLFDFPLLELPNHLGVLVNSVTLADIGQLIGIDFSTYDIPVLIENLKNNVQTALDSVLSSIDANNMTLRTIEQKFGLTLGDNEILSVIKDAPLSSFADIIMGLSVGTIINIDTDTFIKDGDNAVFVKTDRYEKVLPVEYGLVKEGATKYISGMGKDSNLTWKELRYIKKEAVVLGAPTRYVVDNTSNCANFDPENKTEYFRLMEYEAYDTEVTYSTDTEFFVPALSNGFEQKAEKSGQFVSKTKGYISLKTLFTNISMSSSLNNTVKGKTISLTGSFFYTPNTQSGLSVGVATESYGVNKEELLSADSKLSKGNKGFFIAHLGKDAAALQTLAELKINSMGNAADELLNIKIGDILTIDENSSQLLVFMKDKTIKELSSSLDELSLSDVVAIKDGAYVIDANGSYVYQSVAGHYAPYDSVIHSGFPRFSLTYSQNALGKYVLLDGNYYVYNAKDTRFNGLSRFEKTYTPSATGDYARIDGGGYYTLYNPETSSSSTRYSYVDGYIKASIADINRGQGLFYYNSATATMTAYTDGNHGTLYIVGTPDSKVLQRLARTSIGDFSTAFNSLILGDVLDISVDSYGLVAEGFTDMNKFSADKDYFYFEDGLYKLANVFDKAFQNAHSTTKIYTVARFGNGNAILKKLALLKVTEFGSKMTDVIDSLYLGDIMEVAMTAYVESLDGDYVFVTDGGKYYTLYNPAAHGDTFTRYKKIAGFRQASSKEIAENNGLHFYNGTSMASCFNTQAGTLYVQGTPSATVLQRLSRTSIAGFDTAFSTLNLGDVMDIEIDIFTAVTSTDEDKDYYYYDDGIYRLADSTFISSNSTQYYELTRKGAGNAVIKKLAYLSIEQVGTRMGDVIDDLSLGEVIDNLQFSAYVADDNGSFTYIKNGGYYTVFNAAIHDASAPRFAKITGYSIATDAQIKSATNLFYFDTATKKMVEFTDGIHGTLYTTEEASSSVLQRLAKVKIKDFSSSFSDLLLSDVLEIEADIYKKVVGAPQIANEHYIYKDGVYTAVDLDYIKANQDSTYYTLQKAGNGNIVLKKMAFLTIDRMAGSMTDIINSLYMTDLIEIFEFTEARKFVDTSVGDIKADDEGLARWIVAHNSAYTTGTSSVERQYTFVYDANGNYYKTATQYLPALPNQIISIAGANYYKYTQVSPAYIATHARNPEALRFLYYKKADTYEFNPALITYKLSKYVESITSSAPAGNATLLAGLYYRDACDSATVGAIEYSEFKSENLFVSMIGVYVAYVPANLAHSDMEKFYLYTNGYYPASIEDITTATTKYFFDYSTKAYVTAKNANCGDTPYVLLTADSDSKFYFSKLDDGYKKGVDLLFSKRMCETIYFVDQNGGFVYYNKDYVEYDASNAEHNALSRFSAKSGVVADKNQVSATIEGGILNFLSTDKVFITREQSATVLKAFAKKKVTIASLSSVIKDFTIADLIIVEPDSMFDDQQLLDSPLEKIGAVLAAKLQGMNIGDILEWGNISTMSPAVKSILKDVTLADLFKSIEFDDKTGAITINIEKLYGLS